MTHVLSCLGLKTSLIMLIGHQPVQQQRLCALAVMNWRDNLSPLIKTFRARYKHQNRCHITFYILHLSNISAGQYQLWWHLQVTGDTVDNDDHSAADWNITNLLCCLCRVSVFWISPLKLDAGACSSNFLDLVIMCWSQSVMLPVAALEVEEEKWLLAEPFFLLL